METIRVEESPQESKLNAVKNSVRVKSSQAQRSLREHPAKWTGIAIGAGVGAGLLGRYLLHRAHSTREMPDVIVIGGAC